jgi:hypothetical protein
MLAREALLGMHDAQHQNKRMIEYAEYSALQALLVH